MQDGESPPRQTASSPSAGRAPSGQVTPNGSTSQRTTPSPEDIDTALFLSGSSGAALGSKRGAPLNNGSDNELGPFQHKRQRTVELITNEEVDDLAEGFGLTNDHLEELKTFVAVSCPSRFPTCQ